ncbi:MAG: hypothetical protein AAB353_05195 [Candidatus Hydrogenedentota bacterium]
MLVHVLLRKSRITYPIRILSYSSSCSSLVIVIDQKTGYFHPFQVNVPVHDNSSSCSSFVIVIEYQTLYFHPFQVKARFHDNS